MTWHAQDICDACIPVLSQLKTATPTNKIKSPFYMVYTCQDENVLRVYI